MRRKERLAMHISWLHSIIFLTFKIKPYVKTNIYTFEIKRFFMKKYSVLLITLLAAAGSQAQSRKIDENREIINGYPTNNGKVYGDKGNQYPNNSGYPTSSSEVDKINREYDRRINAVRMNPTLSANEKQRRISKLEYERQQRLKEVYSYKNGKYSTNKKYKKNNGKHLGWEKGKGNQYKKAGKKNRNFDR